MGDQRLWLMTAVRGRVVTKGPTLHFHGVTLGKAFPILARSSSLCLHKLPGTVRCWLGVDRWEGKGHHCPLTPPPLPRQEGPSLVSPAAAHYPSPQAPLPSAQPPGLRSALSAEPPEAHWGDGGAEEWAARLRAAGGMGRWPPLSSHLAPEGPGFGAWCTAPAGAQAVRRGGRPHPHSSCRPRRGWSWSSDPGRPLAQSWLHGAVA